MAGRGEDGFPARAGAAGVRHGEGSVLLFIGGTFLDGTFPIGMFHVINGFTKARLVTVLPTCDVRTDVTQKTKRKTRPAIRRSARWTRHGI